MKRFLRGVVDTLIKVVIVAAVVTLVVFLFWLDKVRFVF